MEGSKRLKSVMLVFTTKAMTATKPMTKMSLIKSGSIFLAVRKKRPAHPKVRNEMIRS